MLAIIRRTIYIVLASALLSVFLWLYLGNQSDTGFGNSQLQPGMEMPAGGERRGGGEGRGGRHEEGGSYGKIVLPVVITLATFGVFYAGDFVVHSLRKRKPANYTKHG
ncbi:MAG TPA: hypothetical protein PK299_00070 [Anaerolineales bacterium]|nr:hypothetical protein [Anaerolineales bacterium]